MAVKTVAAPRPGAVAAVLAKSSRWTHGTRKADGREFWIVPGSKPGVSYYADATDCTCPDARERGRTCKHSLAVQQYQQLRQRAARQVAGAEHQPTSSPTSWRHCSQKCGTVLPPEHATKMCDPCWERVSRILDVA